MFVSPDTMEPTQWLAVVHAVNELRPGTFGEPTSTGNGASGRYVEEYPEARITMPPEELRFTGGAVVIVEGKTPQVEAAITLAVEWLGF